MGRTTVPQKRLGKHERGQFGALVKYVKAFKIFRHQKNWGETKLNGMLINYLLQFDQGIENRNITTVKFVGEVFRPECLLRGSGTYPLCAIECKKINDQYGKARWKDAHKKFARLAKKYEKAIARIGKKHTPRLLGLAAAFGSHNARVVGCKKLRNVPLDQMDLLDISSLDTKLAEARRGIGDRVRRIAPVEGAEAAPKEVAPMPPKIVRERRA